MPATGAIAPVCFRQGVEFFAEGSHFLTGTSSTQIEDIAVMITIISVVLIWREACNESDLGFCRRLQSSAHRCSG
mgnify:CR=1 FL=1